jgi:hypothetical protein
MSDRQAVIEAGGPEWPVWDGTRTERWYQIPGQKKELFASGYQNVFIDFWHREWVTAKFKQAEGRLRAARREGEDLQVIVHASFPFTESFGLEFTSVERPDWRTGSDYQATRKSDQIEKGIIAFHATGEGSRRKANDFLKSIGLKGFSNNDWAEIKEESAGLQREYSSYVSKTTPDLFGKDVRLLIEAIGRLADFAKEEGLTIEDLIGSGLVEASYEERIAMLVLERALNRDPESNTHSVRRKDVQN